MGRRVIEICLGDLRSLLGWFLDSLPSILLPGELCGLALLAWFIGNSLANSASSRAYGVQAFERVY